VPVYRTGHHSGVRGKSQRPLVPRSVFFAGLFLVDFFAAFRFRARAARAFVAAAGRRRVLALVFPRFVALTVALLVPAFFVAVRFGVPVRLTGDLVLILAGFVAAARRFEVAVRFRFDDFEADFEARLCVPVRARTRLLPGVDTDRRWRPFTTLRTPGPGTKLVSSPVLQRTMIKRPFTAVTAPERGPAFDDTSI
jgi:hypothetical protein